MTASTEEMDNNVEHISSRELISGYLRRLKDSHIMLKVAFPGLNEIFSSILVVINDNENYIVLDMFHPEAGHLAFLKQRECQINAQHQGVDMSFTAKLDEVIGSDDSPAYKIPFPAELLYHQKRTAFRAQIGASHDIGVTLHNDKGIEYKGSLYNISTGGFCVNVPRKSIEKLQVGEVLSTCRFKISNGASIETAAEIRNIKINEEKKISRIGLRFLEISPQEIRAIQRFVLTLEREQIKRSR